MNASAGETSVASARIRLHVAADLGVGAPVALITAQAHYLHTVMRVRAGEMLRLFNGRDGEWLARADRLTHDRGAMTVVRRLRRQPKEAGPSLLFAPLKKDNTDFVTMKATELGVAELRPVFTERTDAARVNVARMTAQAIEAAEQCGRLTVPAIAPADRLDRTLAAWDVRQPLFVAHPAAPVRGLAEVFAAALGGRTDAPPPAFLIGPEGGFADAELDRLLALPFVSAIRLGPRVLRAETAAVAALTCWQASFGDWLGAAVETDMATPESEG